MRLLCTATGQFIEINNPSEVEYAILSHTWATDSPEQTYLEMRTIQDTLNLPVLSQSSVVNGILLYPKISAATRLNAPNAHIWDDARVSEKIREACAVARDAGYDFIWIDSCCIDKTSSAELSEAINSMYAWYRDASICYAYLADVPAHDDPPAIDSRFRLSRWFGRGWTLQELIAPEALIFLSDDWQGIGTKRDLAIVIHEVTKIDPDILTHMTPLHQVSVATRMSWASMRTTTRVEDRAYSLLGMFDITMPTLYGEGERAFLRLQEEILKKIPDQSLFAWGDQMVSSDVRGVMVLEPVLPPLARSPDAFECLRIRRIPHADFAKRIGIEGLAYPTYSFTPFGLHTQLPCMSYIRYTSTTRSRSPHNNQSPPHSSHFLALLACEPYDSRGHLLAIIFSISSEHHLTRDSSMLALSPTYIAAHVHMLRTRPIYGHLERPQRHQAYVEHYLPLKYVSLTKRSRAMLMGMGYKWTLNWVDQQTNRFTLKKTNQWVVEIVFECAMMGTVRRPNDLQAWVVPRYGSTLIDIDASTQDGSDPSLWRQPFVRERADTLHPTMFSNTVAFRSGRSVVTINLKLLLPRYSYRYGGWDLDLDLEVSRGTANLAFLQADVHSEHSSPSLSPSAPYNVPLVINLPSPSSTPSPPSSVRSGSPALVVAPSGRPIYQTSPSEQYGEYPWSGRDCMSRAPSSSHASLAPIHTDGYVGGSTSSLSVPAPFSGYNIPPRYPDSPSPLWASETWASPHVYSSQSFSEDLTPRQGPGMAMSSRGQSQYYPSDHRQAGIPTPESLWSPSDPHAPASLENFGAAAW